MAKRTDLDWTNEGFDIDETNLTPKVEKSRAASRKAYETHKAAEAQYYKDLREAFGDQIPDGYTLVIKRMAWGALRGIFAPETSASSGGRVKRVLTLRK